MIKRRFAALFLTIVIALMSLPLSLSVSADFTGEVGNVTASYASSTITIDGNGSASEGWNKAQTVTIEDSNLAQAWGAASKVKTSTTLKLMYNSSGIYLLATTFDETPVRSTGTDTEGSSSLHGWNGDSFIFSLDPLQRATSSGKKVPWYCFGLDSSGKTLVYVSQAGTRSRTVTDGSISAATTVNGNYVTVEALITWSTIVSDVRRSDAALSVTAANLYRESAYHTAKVVYADRYSYGASGQPDYRSLYSGSVATGTVVTISRAFTACDTIPGTSTPGSWGSPEKANSNGIYITIGSQTQVETHTEGDWVVTKEPTCTETGTRVKYCTDCGIVLVSETLPAAHTYVNNLVKEACVAEGTVTKQICSVCGAEGATEVADDRVDLGFVRKGTVQLNEETVGIRAFFSLNTKHALDNSIVELGAIVRNNTNSSSALTVDTDGNLTSSRGMAKVTVFKNGEQVGNLKKPDGDTVDFTVHLYNLNSLTKQYNFRGFVIYEKHDGTRFIEYTSSYSNLSYNKIICMQSSHLYDEGVVTTEATTTSTGIMTYTCERCGDTYTEIIPKIVSEDPKLVVTYYDAQNYGTLSNMNSTDLRNVDIVYYTGYDIYGVTSSSLDIRAKNNMTNATEIANAKAINPDVKVLMCLYANNTNFNACVADTATTNTAMKGIVDAMENIGFDGIDVDWEYPDGSDTQKNNTKKFFTALRAELDKRASKNGKTYYLTAAVPQGTWPFSLYDMATLAEKCDYLNVMTYDSLISWQYTQHHTAPYDDPDWAFSASFQSVNSTIAYFTSQGIPANKLLMGCGMYSVDWGSGVADEGTHGLHVFVGHAYSGQVLVRYNELTDFLRYNPSYKVYWDDTCKAMYLYDGSTFISIDNDDSLKAKAEIVNATGAGGLMLFCYSTFRGTSITSSVRNWVDGNTSYGNAINWSYSN